MSKNSKSGKGHSIPSRVVFAVTIDTDDDFTVDGNTQVQRSFTVSRKGDVSASFVQYLLDLHYQSSARNAFKVDDFKKMIGSLDFKSAIQKLLLPKEHFDFTSRVTAGGNHTIVVTLEEIV